MANEEKTSLKYQQLKENLLRQINQGVYASGRCLPPERELCELFSASRMTVRKAVDELVDEQVLYRIRGKGTFVLHEKIMQSLTSLTSFSDDMRARGMAPSSRILLLDRIPAGRLVAEKLSMEVGDDVILLKRLRLADGVPMAIETSYLNPTICDSLVERISAGESMYALYEKLGIQLRRAVQCMEIAPLQSWEADILENHDLTMAMFIQRQTFDQRDCPVEYVESQYRADRYRLCVELIR